MSPGIVIVMLALLLVLLLMFWAAVEWTLETGYDLWLRLTGRRKGW